MLQKYLGLLVSTSLKVSWLWSPKPMSLVSKDLMKSEQSSSKMRFLTGKLGEHGPKQQALKSMQQEWAFTALVAFSAKQQPATLLAHGHWQIRHISPDPLEVDDRHVLQAGVHIYIYIYCKATLALQSVANSQHMHIYRKGFRPRSAHAPHTCNRRGALLVRLPDLHHKHVYLQTVHVQAVAVI